MTLIVLGSINTDLVVKSERLPRPGETVLGGEFFQAAGGKGANQAVAAARAARERVTLLAAVGDDDYGRQALALLARENLATDWIKTVPGEPSGVALILVGDRGENMISVASGANLHLFPRDIDRVPDELFQPPGVLLASLESPLDTVARAIERARGAGLYTILNPAPADPRLIELDVLRSVDLVTPNEIEAELLAGPAVEANAPLAERALSAARRLQSLGCPASIITLGAAGCLVVEDEAVAVPGLPVEPIDTTAAGDAFNGALAVALSEGRTLVEAARWATRAAALSVTRRGAQPSLPTRGEIDAL